MSDYTTSQISHKEILPKWFCEQYAEKVKTTMSSLTQPKENLVLVHQSNDPDLPQSIFEDLGHLAQETGRTVEAMFLFSQSGENRIKTASKYTVKADGKVIQDSWVDNLHMPVSRQFFSGTNKRVSLKDTK